MGKQARRSVRLELTWRSIFRVMLGVLLAFASIRLWPLAELLILAILLAVALYPIVRWSCRRGWPRWVGLSLATVLLLAIVGGVFGLLGPLVYRQAGTLVEKLPQLKEDLLGRLRTTGFPTQALEGWSGGGVADPVTLGKKMLSVGKLTVTGLVNFALFIVFAIYLMVDGPRAWRWLVAFFPAEDREKLSQASSEVADLIVAYVAGQGITSALCAGYVFGVLSVLHVPMALLLGLAAGIFDILPIIGFFLSVLPAMAMALTVSTKTALLVLVLYAAYHLFENYFIVPKVYGRKLNLSTLAVLLAISAAGLLTGVFGAIAILPLVAAYPTLERLWLDRHLEPGTVDRHDELDRTPEVCGDRDSNPVTRPTATP